RVCSSFLLISGTADHRDLHSFPTRRSSDLSLDTPGRARCAARTSAASFGLCGFPGTASGIGARSAPAGAGSPYGGAAGREFANRDRKSTRLNSSHVKISYAVFCLKKKNTKQ